MGQNSYICVRGKLLDDLLSILDLEPSEGPREFKRWDIKRFLDGWNKGMD